jgi:site-specific DNA-methyltransferase (adenine-specific)
VDIAALPGPRGGDALGRWPANVILTDPVFDGNAEGVVGGGETGPAGVAWALSRGFSKGAYVGGEPNGKADLGSMTYGDDGTYSRFFLITKAARGEREPAIAGQLEEREVLIGAAGHKLNPMTGKAVVDIPRENTHPTVKPLELMRHLVRLVTPPRGVVLDPFLGSGTTALAAEMEGFGWVGIEKEPEYVAIAEARLNGVPRGLGL